MESYEKERVRERYLEARKRYEDAQKELGSALRKMHGVGEYPSPPPRLRFPLEDERRGVTRKVQIGVGEEGIKAYITAGTYSDGTLGELFITAEKQGTFVSGLMDSFAKVFSISLQSGASLPHLIDNFKFTKFEPRGVTNNPEIPLADSVLDYVAKWAELKYVNRRGHDD